MIGSLLVGAVYWIFTTCGDGATQESMWSPGGGLIEPEPWLQSANGGYGGWSPSSSSAYAAWAPGAYLNLFTPTTVYVPITTTSTRRTTRSRRTRLPPHLPLESDAPETPSVSSLSEGGEKNEFPDLDTLQTETPSVVKPSDEKSSTSKPHVKEPDLKPPGQEPGKPPIASDSDYQMTDPNMYEVPQPLWRSRDQNEEAYEENPHNFMNTRTSDKQLVEGWGYDYEN